MALSLGHAQQDASERAVWSGVRALREREMLLRRLAAVATSLGDAGQAAAAQAEADRLQKHVATLKEMAQRPPQGEPLDDTA